MSTAHVFLSHAHKDDNFVKELREALESHGISVWADSRNLRGGSKLSPEIDEAIDKARQVIVVLSPNAVNSPWVRKEISKAITVENSRRNEGYRVIPLLLPGIEPSALALWFEEEPVGVCIELKFGGLSEVLTQILTALGERLPTDHEPQQTVTAHPVEELILKLSDTTMRIYDGKRRVAATAILIYEPADKAARSVESKKRFEFVAPLGDIETEDLSWYLEKYFIWPTGIFKERATRIEAQLPEWGQTLYDAAFSAQVAKEPLNAWQQTAKQGELCFSVFVDSELSEGATEREQTLAREAATKLLGLPWELLHDGRGFLFHGKNPVCVRRRLPNYHSQPVRPTALPIRILCASPRPEDDRAGYFDHRVSAKALVEGLESLGELAELTVLTPPTFPALEEALQRAADAETPFDVVHFDGHGIYDKEVGLGGLCFEHPNDIEKLEHRAMQLIHAEKLAGVIRDHRIPLVFLEACETAKTEENPTASLAAKLLGEGVTSVVAMSHSVLIETAHRFVKAFYKDLAAGKRVARAMIAGQRALHSDTYRGKMMGAGELHLQDWFVPVLYQEKQDPQLIMKLPPKEVQQLEVRYRRLSLGELPETPSYEFIGRSRELLALERLLHRESYAVVRGLGGAGKTTLAVELARWLVRTGRFRRAAFVSIERYMDARGVLDTIGRQLLPHGENWSVAQYPDLNQALQLVTRALADRATIIVLDNLESVLPDSTEEFFSGTHHIGELFDLCRTLLEGDSTTRIVFTSRERLPAPFDKKHCERPLGPLDRPDAIKLVSSVMAKDEFIPNPDDPGDKEGEIEELVEVVNCHARTLVKLAPELARFGVQATTENLSQLMADLDKKYPGDRENSLYASVELSLRRMPRELRAQTRGLCMFHGGASLTVLNHVLDADDDDVETVQKLASALIEVGLAEAMPYGHLRLDPALSSYLRGQMSAVEEEQVRERWAVGMRKLAGFLYKQLFKDAKLALQLVLPELPNLLALLTWARDALTPEEVVGLAGCLESLLAPLGRPRALAQVRRSREEATQRLGGSWSHAQYVSADMSVVTLLEQNRLLEARAASEKLLQRALAAGPAAYDEAPYDIANAHLLFGRVLNEIGFGDSALAAIREAQQRFQVLADAGDTAADVAVCVALSDAAACQVYLGRYNEASVAYEESFRRAEMSGNRRAAAVARGNLGTVRLAQKRYSEALEHHQEACRIFQLLGEQRQVAKAWYQIGMVHENSDQLEQAEHAYSQSLATNVQQQDHASEASTLNQLGNLYCKMERVEEAVTFYRQALGIAVRFEDKSNEALRRNNMAYALIKLKRYDEARREVQSAIACNQTFGHAGEPWTTWELLHDLDSATGNEQAAIAARGKAIAAYLDYRRAGGESQSNQAQLFSIVLQAIQQGATTEAEQHLDELWDDDDPLWLKALASAFGDILRGDRRPALTSDPNLDYRNVVELQLLLEALAAN